MDVKNFTAQIKAVGPDDGLGEGQFSAYASVFGNKDSYGDVVEPGAFTDTLTEWKSSGLALPLLWGHDMADPFSNIGHIVDAKQDERGLLVTPQFDLDNPKARQVYQLVKGRRVNQMSFAYDEIDAGPGQKDGETIRSLRKLKLYEVSVVPIGANQETEILAVKANLDALTQGIKSGRVISSKNESAIRSAYEALGSVLAALEPSDQEKASGTSPSAPEDAPPGQADAPAATSSNPSAKALANQKLQLTDLGSQAGKATS